MMDDTSIIINGEENIIPLFKSYRPQNLSGARQMLCNRLLYSCQHPECDHTYSDSSATVCPTCGTRREFCSQASVDPPQDTACKYHSKKLIKGLPAKPRPVAAKGLLARLPRRLLTEFLDAYEDEDLLNFTDSISLMRARRIDLLEKLDETPSHKHWSAIQEEFDRFRQYRRKAAKGNPRAAKEMQNSLDKLEELIFRGYLDSTLWREIIDLETKMVKVREAEIKRREKIANLITPEQFKKLLAYLVNSVKTRVSNKDEYMAVIADIQRLEW